MGARGEEGDFVSLAMEGEGGVSGSVDVGVCAHIPIYIPKYEVSNRVLRTCTCTSQNVLFSFVHNILICLMYVILQCD